MLPQSTAYVPAAHGQEHAVPLKVAPGPVQVHHVRPLESVAWLGQDKHREEEFPAPVLNVFTGHSVHGEMPSGEYSPAGHVVAALADAASKASASTAPDRLTDNRLE